MLTFIMLTWNRKMFLERCIDAFLKRVSGNYPYEFLIIDNGSTDETKEYLEEICQGLTGFSVEFNTRNKGIAEYKKLLKRATGDYICIIDDDVIDFPENFDEVLVSCIDEFVDYGFLSLDVIQNEHTNGAKPGPENYTPVKGREYTLQDGPAGGWCAILRKRDYDRIRRPLALKRISMRNGEDGSLSKLMRKKLGLRCGVIDNVRCFHASGPYYSKKFGYLNRDIAKYRESGLTHMTDIYEAYK